MSERKICKHGVETDHSTSCAQEPAEPAPPAAPLCDCGAGNDAYLACHADKCSLNKYAQPKCGNCARLEAENAQLRTAEPPQPCPTCHGNREIAIEAGDATWGEPCPNCKPAEPAPHSGRCGAGLNLIEKGNHHVDEQ